MSEITGLGAKVLLDDGVSVAFDIRDLSFRYGETKVLDSLSLVIPRGEFIGVVGPNGCGKSTLLDLLVGNLKPATGTILFNGRHLDNYSKKELSKEIALVPQNFYINFPFTAKEIVMMGRYPHIPRFAAPSAVDRKMVTEIMGLTETDGFTHRFITELSGGERQRVVYARALAQDTPVLILDEATSNLDVNHAISLLNLAAAGVKNGKTVITVLQDINLAAGYCDRIIFMKNGGVQAQGFTDEVLTSRTIQEVFDVESKVSFEPYTNSKHVVFKR